MQYICSSYVCTYFFRLISFDQISFDLMLFELLVIDVNGQLAIYILSLKMSRQNGLQKSLRRQRRTCYRNCFFFEREKSMLSSTKA